MISVHALRPAGEGDTTGENLHDEMIGIASSVPQVAIEMHSFSFALFDTRRYRSRNDGRDDRYSSKHRSREENRRVDDRDDRSHMDSSRYKDRRSSKDIEDKPAESAEDQPTDQSLSAAAVTTEAPKQRPALKAGPAGGAYIPPFRLRQV